MENKDERLHKIRQLIQQKEIGTQEALLHLLKNEGITTTQATLSRDLKTLKVAKSWVQGLGYVYTIPSDETAAAPIQFDSPVQVSGFLSVSFSHNLAVIKTMPGYASSIATIIDSLNFDEVLGTISGDDTILVILKEQTSRDAFRRSLQRKIPSLKGVL